MTMQIYQTRYNELTAGIFELQARLEACRAAAAAEGVTLGTVKLTKEQELRFGCPSSVIQQLNESLESRRIINKLIEKERAAQLPAQVDELMQIAREYPNRKAELLERARAVVDGYTCAPALSKYKQLPDFCFLRQVVMQPHNADALLSTYPKWDNFFAGHIESYTFANTGVSSIRYMLAEHRCFDLSENEIVLIRDELTGFYEFTQLRKKNDNGEFYIAAYGPKTNIDGIFIMLESYF